MKKLKRKLDKLFDEIIPTKTVFAWDFKSDHIVCNPKARKKKSKRKLAEEILKGHEAAVVVVFDKLLDGPMQINEGDILIDEVLILRRTDKDIRKRMTDAFKKGCDYAYVMTISNEQADEMISLNEFLRLSEGLPIDLGWLAEKYKLEKAALVVQKTFLDAGIPEVFIVSDYDLSQLFLDVGHKAIMDATDAKTVYEFTQKLDFLIQVAEEKLEKIAVEFINRKRSSMGYA